MKPEKTMRWKLEAQKKLNENDLFLQNEQKHLKKRHNKRQRRRKYKTEWLIEPFPRS